MGTPQWGKGVWLGEEEEEEQRRQKQHTEILMRFHRLDRPRAVLLVYRIQPGLAPLLVLLAGFPMLSEVDKPPSAVLHYIGTPLLLFRLGSFTQKKEKETEGRNHLP